MNARLVQQLIDSGALRSPKIIAAFEAIERADFVPTELQEIAYIDRPLPIGFGATISQPTTVAFMLELLDVQEEDRILDVGAGSGWTAALLAYVVGPGGSVHAVELIPHLVELGNKNLHKYYPLVNIVQSGDVLGLPEKAPFDRILVSAAAEELPHELVQQLTVGGRMVIPIKDSIMRIDRLSAEDFKTEEFPGFAFVPLR